MYSHEDRIRAVKLFIKLGKRVRLTIGQLGYPTKNSLKNWHLEYERSRYLAAGYVRSRPKYSNEQKRVAVDHYLTHGRCIAANVRLGYPGRETLVAWIDELHPGSRQRIVGNEPRLPEMKKAAVPDLCTRHKAVHRRLPKSLV